MPDAPHWRTLHRHAFVHVAREARSQVGLSIADPACRKLVFAWLGEGRPLIVRRQASDFAAETTSIAVGLALPPAEGKLRIALHLPPAAIDHVAPPPRLSAVCADMSARWRRVLEALDRRGAEHGIVFRVFGSAAWQAVTGLNYLTDHSDIDLLWRPADRAALEAGTALLQECNDLHGTPLDGEILFGSDAAVSWREWARCTDRERVLVKRLRGGSLCTRNALLGLMQDGATAMTVPALAA
jgi:phosphoribosyl-dephospho-CoA transferase